jgi:ABC-2 type transport system ATP-binding protein
MKAIDDAMKRGFIPSFADAPSPGTEVVIRCADLTLRYGRKVAVDALGFEVVRGSALALLGRNGAGKSTLVQALLGLRPVDGGGIQVFGEDPWAERRLLMTRIGAVLERPHLPNDATLRSLVRYLADVRPGLVRSVVEDRFASHHLDLRSRFGALSRGQQTQVCLELALASQPELIVLDDPLLGLDVVARAAILDRLVETLAESEVTLLITTHDLDAAERLATHVGFLDHGRLVLHEAVDALLARHRRVVGLVGDADVDHSRGDIPWPCVAVASALGDQLVTAQYRDDVACPPGLSTAPLTLEQIFRLHANSSRLTDGRRDRTEDAA